MITLSLAAVPSEPTQMAPIADGPFKGNLESLKGNRYPKWFTDGKLGIWSHWGPQAVPMEGDWYAREMYREGTKDYKDHLARYGHPSKHGFKDIIPLWKAERWDPDRLMALYKKAGARYFVSMGVHHDNFDLWDSKHNRWNAVKMGPKRNVVAEWAKAARKQGLKFGVSEHLGASFTWYQASRGADKEGPMAGVPYDGSDPANEDLYHWAAQPGDTGWYTTDPRWHAHWYQRVKDLVDQHRPDMLYTDGGLPFGAVGESMVAHLYNTSIAANRGRQEAVYACKQPSDGRWAQDVERGVLGKIQTHPWQTDTSIGDWYYNKNWKYRGADWVIHTLVDVVSKNGNLLINVVQRPDGSLDPEAEKVLADMAEWMAVHGESIYGTRPWVSYGEGPTLAKGGAFKEDFGFTARDVRYVQKGTGTVYATLMGRPAAGEVLLTALAQEETKARIKDVKLLGSKASLRWTWTAEGLRVTMPAEAPSDIAVVLKITGSNLRDFAPKSPTGAPLTVVADADGLYTLGAGKAELHGDGINTETRDGQENIGFWDNAADWASWTVEFAAPGRYEVRASVAGGATSFGVEVAGNRLVGKAPATGGWDRFQEVVVGTVEIGQAGKHPIAVRAANPAEWRPINLRNLVLKRLP
ncbi:MAG: alpha-L-fucosidase [Fimbriimonas sp.]